MIPSQDADSSPEEAVSDEDESDNVPDEEDDDEDEESSPERDEESSTEDESVEERSTEDDSVADSVGVLVTYTSTMVGTGSKGKNFAIDEFVDFRNESIVIDIHIPDTGAVNGVITVNR